MDPVRADEERTGGIIHKPMFERLLLCDYALADLTTANANVFYELGVRHAARPATTLSIFARNQSLPFDVGFLSALPYDLGVDNVFGSREAAVLKAAERVGNLPWALDEVSDSMRRRMAYRATAVLNVVFPIVLVAFGLVGGWIVIAMAMPLITLISQLSS